ncbi:MAG: OsmC family protein [Helicobacteraceae bacterium]|jgi:putative redox protein|nr:OsmC family protein [Helicobacteraceae bacterium]
MRVDVTHLQGFDFEALTSRGQKFVISKDHIGPQEYFAIGAISCSAMDIVLLPQKQGKVVKNLSIGGDFERATSAPFRFVAIDLIYAFDSDGSDQDALRWVLSSLESYCTTLNTVRYSAKITYSIKHNGNLIADHQGIMSGDAGAMGLSAEDMGGGVCAA